MNFLFVCSVIKLLHISSVHEETNSSEDKFRVNIFHDDSLVGQKTILSKLLSPVSSMEQTKV